VKDTASWQSMSHKSKTNITASNSIIISARHCFINHLHTSVINQWRCISAHHWAEV